MKSVISLFDYTGSAVMPWATAGYAAYIVDIQHTNKKEGSSHGPGIHTIHHDLNTPWLVPSEIIKAGIAFVFAFPPCTHLSVSGARWFKGKGLGALAESIQLFHTAVQMCEWLGAPYIIENPVSTISTYWRKPDYTFHPHQFTGYCRDDNYTKKTCLWTGNGFVMPEQFKDGELSEPDDRIHKAAPGPDRADFRSATPSGFARAVYLANNKLKGSI